MVERDGLENRCTRKCTEGSNPSPSASQIIFGDEKHKSLESKLWEEKLDAL